MSEVNTNEKVENTVQDNTQEKIRSERKRQQTSSMSLMKEFYIFLGERKKFWLMPIVLVMVLLGALIIFSQASVIAPFIYTLF